MTDKIKKSSHEKEDEKKDEEKRRTKKMMNIGGASKELEEIKCSICTILGSH